MEKMKRTTDGKGDKNNSTTSVIHQRDSEIDVFIYFPFNVQKKIKR